MRRILALLLLLLPISTLYAADNVDLLWQGETYAPPFYLGKTLWGNQTRVTLVAIPHTLSGSGLNPANLIYKWTRDDTVLGTVSGLGKRAVSFNDSSLSLTTQISVEVTSSDGTSIGSSSVTLAPKQPEILVVEDNPLYGLMLHESVGKTFALDGQEVSFVALPLFVGASSRTSVAEAYSWITSSDTRSGNKVTYRIPDNSSGNSQVTVRAENKNSLIQPLDKSFLVQFGNQNSL